MRNDRRSPSFWLALSRQMRLAWRLFWDRRVPFTYKLLPLATAAYILSPIDLLPDVILGMGQLDDLGLFLLGVQLFVMICPRGIVAAILEEMEGSVIDGKWRRTDRNPPNPPQLPKSD
ncbi:MAG TPA: DUF1232 domain-containing protein [Anaerolineae bacterium]|nr:DUF1232 domain-containing protein [Anaerolineae bacterium]